ncbi:MAG TPA: hypothetical protein VJ577_11325 [Burkholderiaceae bacterium]|nr:hypothetical protein [Burkholderiaceae bacterium]
MSTVLSSVRPSEWLIKCNDAFLKDKDIHTVTITSKRERALPMTFDGANRLMVQLNNVYPSMQWAAVPAQRAEG